MIKNEFLQSYENPDYIIQESDSEIFFGDILYTQNKFTSS